MEIAKGASNGFVDIFSGIRRAGKSTLMEIVRQKNTERDYYLNFDDERLSDFSVEDFSLLEECFFRLSVVSFFGRSQQGAGKCVFFAVAEILGRALLSSQ